MDMNCGLTLYCSCQDRNGSFLAETTAWEGTAKTKVVEESNLAQLSKTQTDEQGASSTTGSWWT